MPPIITKEREVIVVGVVVVAVMAKAKAVVVVVVVVIQLNSLFVHTNSTGTRSSYRIGRITQK